MTSEKTSDDRASGLRKLAEERLREKQKSRGPAEGLPGKTEDAQALIQELQIHHIELEMQNEELRSTRYALEESRDRYADLYDFAPVGYFTCTPEGLIKEANLTGALLLGTERQKLINNRLRRFVSPGGYDTYDRHMVSILKQVGTQVCEVTLRREDGSLFPARLNSISIDLPAGQRGANSGAPMIRTVLTDITDFKKLEEQLHQAEKLQVVGLLAGGVAHEFNNILTAIIGCGEITLMKMAIDDPLRANIETIMASSFRAANLTQSLLALGRKQMISRKPIDINEIIRRTEKVLVMSLGACIALKTSLNPPSLDHGKSGELIIMGDELQLEQILMNLAANAREAMPYGGVFSIATTGITMDEGFIKVQGYGKPGGYALITLSDTGRGMDDAIQKRLFEPFFTTKELGQGPGLGLSAVYGIIKQNEGYITVCSKPGRGATFRIYLPLL